MGRRNKNNINYKRLREKRRSKQDYIEGKRLEKLEKANYRRKLKVSIELRIKTEKVSARNKFNISIFR
jgi:hypothetical protein